MTRGQITGKKASASPLETALRACPAISEAIVFGASRPVLGVAVVPASDFVTTEDVLARVHHVNSDSASYAQILDELVIILSPERAAQIPKTSKGSVIRPRALTIFADIIDDAYKRLETGPNSTDACGGRVPDVLGETEEDIKSYIRTIVSQALYRRPPRGIANGTEEIDDHDDLFNAGVDSVQAAWIRSSLQQVGNLFSWFSIL